MASLQMSQQQSQRQELNLQQAMFLSKMMELPPVVLDATINIIETKPQEVEGLLTNLNGTHRPEEGVKAIFGELAPKNKNPGYNGDGFLFEPCLEKLSGLIDSKATVISEPDVHFIGRKGNKPEIIFNQYLCSKPKLQLFQIPNSCPQTRNLWQRLTSIQDWRNRKTIQVCELASDIQREFIETLNPWELHNRTVESLAFGISVCEPTAYRLLKNKYAKITSTEGVEETHPFQRLFPSRDSVSRYKIVHRLNEELEKDGTLNPQQLSDNIGGIPRRTITKYISQSNMPNSAKERKQILQEYPETQFQIPYYIK